MGRSRCSLPGRCHAVIPDVSVKPRFVLAISTICLFFSSNAVCHQRFESMQRQPYFSQFQKNVQWKQLRIFWLNVKHTFDSYTVFVMNNDVFGENVVFCLLYRAVFVLSNYSLQERVSCLVFYFRFKAVRFVFF